MFYQTREFYSYYYYKHSTECLSRTYIWENLRFPEDHTYAFLTEMCKFNAKLGDRARLPTREFQTRNQITDFVTIL
jgi:hypothetical protein